MTGSTRVLHAIHDFLPRHRAGSEIYAAELCQELVASHHVTVLCAEYNPSRAHAELTWRVHEGLPVVELTNNWICDSFMDTYKAPLVASRIEQVLDAVEPDVVHVHSLLNLTFDLPALARARGIPVVATLHDYTLVCPSGGQRIHQAEWHVCDQIDADRCATCFGQSQFSTQMSLGRRAQTVARVGLARRGVDGLRRWSPTLVERAAGMPGLGRRFAITADEIRERLSHARRVFDDIDLFVSPSPSLATEFGRLGIPASKIRVSDYGFRRMEKEPRRERQGPLRIGYVGTLVWHKGAHVLLDAVRLLPPETYELVLHGDPDVFPSYVAGLRRQAEGLPVRFAGGFESDRVSGVYAGLDLLVVPSLWLENSPLVIHEAFMAGVPVIGARMGGIADLVSDGRNGRLYDARSPQALADALRAVVAEPEVLRDWSRALPPVKSIARDAAEWGRTYRDVIERTHSASSPA